ncbi:DUF6478 family protein [Aestuariivita sp.]|jgi:hypothetical protein|uniref:DUF6478 family protein n=1 Tax=Aestuariivita sp. TaxID=1872407 RepID=UPI00216EDD9F|nr:DUF6478 family protein [Aestuariivita sp.]MCE8007395.1 hypothetical protein [Aestuariivita sp.]
MAFQFGTVMDRVLHSSTLRWWRNAARQAPKADPVSLRRYRYRARQLRTYLNDVIYAAEEKLALPTVGSDSFPKPFGTDWAWRPQLWRGPLPVPGMSSVQTKSTLGAEVTLFHDCAHSELTLRQLRNLREEDLAPYGLRMDVFTFDGSFLSLVIDMPQAAVSGLRKDHILRIDTIVEVEKGIEIFARLNIKHGPNTEQFVRELPLNEENVMVEFDLAYSNLNEKRVEKAWLDLIFEGPEMNQVILRDLTFSRRPRAPM